MTPYHTKGERRTTEDAPAHYSREMRKFLAAALPMLRNLLQGAADGEVHAYLANKLATYQEIALANRPLPQRPRHTGRFGLRFTAESRKIAASRRASHLSAWTKKHRGAPPKKQQKQQNTTAD